MNCELLLLEPERNERVLSPCEAAEVKQDLFFPILEGVQEDPNFVEGLRREATHEPVLRRAGDIGLLALKRTGIAEGHDDLHAHTVDQLQPVDGDMRESHLCRNGSTDPHVLERLLEGELTTGNAVHEPLFFGFPGGKFLEETRRGAERDGEAHLDGMHRFQLHHDGRELFLLQAGNGVRLHQSLLSGGKEKVVEKNS